MGLKSKAFLKLAGGALAVLCLLSLSGCGSSNGANVVSVGIISSAGPILILGQSTTLTATVSGANDQSVSWSQLQYTTTSTTNGMTTTSKPINAPTDGSFGNFSPNPTSSTSPSTAVYTAPDPSKFQLPSQTQYPGLQIVITATSKQSPSKSATINITLTSGIKATITPVNASVPTAEQQQFFASLTNDVKLQGVTWLITQNVISTTNGVTNTVPQLPTCSPTCGTITPDTNNKNVAVYTAPSAVPTAINPLQSSTINPGASTPQNLTIYAIPVADNSAPAIGGGTITITTGGPITFNGITPTLAPQGATLWDIYLDAPNISSSSQIFLTYPNSSPVVKNSASGQIKILFPLPPPPCTATTTTTCPTVTPLPSTGARLRLNATDLATSGAVTVSVVDPAQPCNSLAVGTPCSATGATSFNILAVRPTSTASVPDDVVQGTLAQQARVIIDGGYFGPKGTLAAPFFQGAVIVQDQNNPSSARQLNALMSTNQINQGSPGLYPLSVIGNATSPPPPPSVTNIAVFPAYSNTPPQVVASGIAAGTNPGAIDVDTSLGVAVVAETGSNGVQFYAVAKGMLTPIDSTGATCAAACPVTSQTFPNVLINTPTGLSVNRTNHTVAIVNYGNQSVTVLPIPVPGAAAQTPAPGTPFTIDISGALQGAVTPAPIPYSIGVDPDSNVALVAYSSTAVSTSTGLSANLGFTVNLNPNTATNPYGCILGQAINASSNQFGQCLSAQVTLNNCAYPQIATAPHGHLAVATPGGIILPGVSCVGGAVTGVDVTKPSTSNVLQSATLTAGLVTVTIDPTQCPPPLANPNPSATPPTNPCPFSMIPGNAGTVLMTGLKPGNSSNGALFNGNFSVMVTSNNSFTYSVTNTTASDSAQGGCQTSGATKTCATVFYGPPNLTIQITQSLQGVAINPITSTVAMADANSTSVPIDLLNALDQSVSSIGVSATCTAYTTSCSSAPELLRTTAVSWQPYTNEVVSYNPNLNQVSIFDPVSRQRYAFACELNSTTKPNAGSTCITDPSTAPTTVCANLSACQQMFLNQITLLGSGTANISVTNGTTGSLTLWGGVAVDPATNQAFVLMSGSGTIDIIDLGGPNNGATNIAIPIKPTQVSEIIVPSPTGAVGTIGGIPNALVPQATLTCVPPPGSPAGTCNLSPVKIFGSGFVSGLQVRLNGVDITTQGGVINNIAANGREVDVTIPPFFLSAPHHYALDVLSSGAQSNAVDFIVIQSVDLSKVCTNSSGNPVNTQPSSIAIADQIANGPFSPFGLISVSGCNSVVKLDLNPASPTFGQLLGSPVSVGTTPQGVAISQKLGLAVVANHGTNTVSILDLTQNPVVEKVPDVTTDSNPTGVAIDDAIGAAVVANTTANDVSVINLESTTSLTATNVGGIQQPIAVAIDPDRGTNNQGQAVITGVTLSVNGPSGTLFPVEIGFNPPIPGTTTPSGFVTSPPTGIVFDPTVVTNTANPGAFYAISSGSNTITQYNPDSGGGSSVNVGVNPTSLAINPQTGAILTSNSGSNTISIVDTLSNPFRTIQTLGLPGSPTFGVAIDQFTNLAVIVDQANMRVLLFPMPH